MNKTNNLKAYRSIPELFARCKSFCSRHLFIVILCGTFFAISAILILTIFNHQLNPDASSYFTIAQKYAHGDIKHAINGYWGPLFSWLLVPAVWFSISLPVAGKFVSVIAAVVLLCVVYSYFRSRSVNRWISGFILIALSLLLLEWSVVEAIAPDLLIATLIVMFAIQLTDFLEKPTTKAGALLGITGASMYFAKGFGFYLFVGIIVIVGLWQWWTQDARHIKVTARRYAATICAFALLTVPFIGVISVKYHTLTINNAGAYNYYVTSPQNNTVQPIEYMGPLPLPNDSAISAWEDPTIFTHLLPSWSPLSSHTNIGYFINDIFYQNVLKIISYVYGLGPLVCVGLVTLLMGVIQRKYRQRDQVIFSVITLVMFAAYAVVFVLSRYLWAAAVLGILALGLWLNYAMQKKAVNVRQVITAGFLVCGIMALTIGNYIGDSKNPDIEWYKSAISLRKIIPENSKIMSDSFNHSYHACFYLHLKCYNVVAPPPVGKQQAYYQSLKDMGVKYYVDYHTRQNDLALNAFISTYFVKVDSHVTERVPVTTYKIK